MSTACKCFIALAALALGVSNATSAAQKTQFDVAWTVYVGWAPWDYADRSGILRKWANRYGLDIRLHRVDKYADSLAQYGAGKFDACAMTNVDMLSLSTTSAVNSTAIIVGDFSNGNDGIALKGASRLDGIRNLPVYLVKGSISHFLLTRALSTVGLDETAVRIIDTPDSRIAGSFAAAPAPAAVVTWKPQLSQVLAMSGVTLVFDSSRLRDEIIDLMVVRTEVSRDNPDFALALTGAWYETLALLQAGTSEGSMRRALAKSLGTDLAGLSQQLATTKLLLAPEARGFMRSPALSKSMELARSFCADHTLSAEARGKATPVGIELPGARLLGNPNSIRVRFDDGPTSLVAEGKLGVLAP